MGIKTGIEVLDGALRGGLPEQRAVLVTGGPGAGKSTLAMQFLQEGLRNGDRCLYVSTEQTAAELRDSFAPYEFAVDHPNLTFTTVHATPGHTIEEGEKEVLTVETLSGEESLGGGFSAPFTNKYIVQLLKRYAPCDRVVFDSISGLAAMADDDHVFRRAVLDMIRLFTDEFGATTVFTAEEIGADQVTGDVASSDALQFNTHGVINVWREQVDGDYHRFLRVAKMRGVNHDTRQYEVILSPSGVELAPKYRTRPDEFMDRSTIPSGIPGLDELSGGFTEGGTALLEHDGRADVDPIVIAMVTEAVERGETIVLFPSASMTPDRLDQMLPDRVASVSDLIAANRLFVLDFVGAWRNFHENAFTLGHGGGLFTTLLGKVKLFQLRRAMKAARTIHANRGRNPAFAVMYTESLLDHLDPTEVRQMYHWAKETILKGDDRVLFVQNPGVMDERLAEFYAYDSEQILKTWLYDGGLQYVRLDKSPGGELGSTRLVRYTDAEPYVRVQALSQGGTAREREREPTTNADDPSTPRIEGGRAAGGEHV